MYVAELARIVRLERQVKRDLARAQRGIERDLTADRSRTYREWRLAAMRDRMQAVLMKSGAKAFSMGAAFASRRADVAPAQFALGETDLMPNVAAAVPSMYYSWYFDSVGAALHNYTDGLQKSIAIIVMQGTMYQPDGKTPMTIRAQTAAIRNLVAGMQSWRAERIARTETMRLWNLGHYATMEQQGPELVGYEYSVVLDDRTSHYCRPLAGVKVDRWDDPRIPPLHPHCRTILEPVYSYDPGMKAGVPEGGWAPPEIVDGVPGFGLVPPPIELIREARGPKPGAPPPKLKLDKSGRVKVKPPKEPTAPTAPADDWPPDPDALTVVRKLGGSTGAELVEDASRRLYVRKRGASAEHLRAEVCADRAYQALGVAVPECRLYEGPKGPTKLARFIEGTTYDRLDAAGKAAAAEDLRKGMLADAILGNRDVVGMSGDNILVDKLGKVWRIDNGGSLSFRAQGARKDAKDWGAYVGEVWSLRDARFKMNYEVYGPTSWGMIEDQWRELSANRQAAVLAAGPDGKVLEQRFDWAADLIGRTSWDLREDRFVETHREGFCRALSDLRQAGLTEKLPKQMQPPPGIKPGAPDWRLKDENGKPWDDFDAPGGPNEILRKAIEASGGEWKWIAGWAQGQKGSSYSPQALAIKHLMVSWRDVPDTDYFWRHDRGLGPDKAKSYYDAFLRLIQSQRSLGSVAEAEAYLQRAWHLQHAFVYETLGKIKSVGNDLAGKRIKLWRTEPKECKELPGVKAGTILPVLRGANESFSKDWSVTAFADGFTTRQVMPHHRCTGVMWQGPAGHFFAGGMENEITAMPQGILVEARGAHKTTGTYVTEDF